MAGRPKTMAKRGAAIEERAFQLILDLGELRPEQYVRRDRADDNDSLAWWWNESVRAVSMASIAVAILLGHLEERAGFDWEALEREREQRRGLVPCEESKDNATENAEGSRLEARRAN